MTASTPEHPRGNSSESPVAHVWSRSGEDALAALSATPNGLSPELVSSSRERWGKNQLAARPRPGLLRRLGAQFTDVTVLALIVAAIVAVVLGQLEDGLSPLEQFGDAIAISVIVILNALIGLVQESRAERALEALSDSTAPTARVLRAGKQEVVASIELVPGDIVLLEEGSRVPADARLLKAESLAANESALTGESTAVEKVADVLLPEETDLAERKNCVFLGTFITRGKASALVVSTGMRSSLGEIAQMLEQIDSPVTPLQRDLKRFGLQIVAICVVLGVAVFLVMLLQGQGSIRVLLLTAVSLAVAAIPEGLPAVTTIVLALGVQRMAKRNALVRKLPAVETLGSADTICTDKTGTLTQNRMTVRRAASLDQVLELTDDTPRGELPGDLGQLVLASRYTPAARIVDEADQDNARKSPHAVGDPTDAALLNFHLEHAEHVAPESTRDLPFDAERKLSSGVGEGMLFVHGAAEAVLGRSNRVWKGGREAPLSAADRSELERIETEWGGAGLRVLAVAQRKVDPAETDDATEQDLCVLGLLGLSDPPRPEVKGAIATAGIAGVRTVMITGDHPITAGAIAREVGIGGESPRVLPGAELETLSDSELEERAEQTDVVARATAGHKLRFVEALRRRGHIVAMTGDGVNDAPALRAASIGIAMGETGTDVAREAADLVLADDHYATIIAAIEEGRTIFANIRRFILFLLSINAGLVLAVLVGALLGWPPLLTPTQILWINLVTNGLPALALGSEPPHGEPMQEPPRDPKGALLGGRDLVWILGYGSFMAVVGLITFGLFREDSGRARSLAFLVLSVGPLLHSLNCRHPRQSLFQVGVLTNPKLWGAIAVGLVLQAAALYMPGLTKVFSVTSLSAREVLFGLGLCVTFWLAGELQKAIARALHPER